MKKNSFFLISAVVPITDETFSLKKTVLTLINENDKYLKEIIIVASKKNNYHKFFERSKKTKIKI